MHADERLSRRHLRFARGVDAAKQAAANMANIGLARPHSVFINSKPRRGFHAPVETPLSCNVASCPQ
jgi:hypothetical protein